MIIPPSPLRTALVGTYRAGSPTHRVAASWGADAAGGFRRILDHILTWSSRRCPLPDLAGHGLGARKGLADFSGEVHTSTDDTRELFESTLRALD